MGKTKIEWVKNPDGTQGFTWNPIRGRCPVRCELPDGRVYCYGHRHYDLRPWLENGVGKYGALVEPALSWPRRRKKPAGIFACSLFELFYPGKVGDSYREVIFHIIEKSPQHRFYILTKFPQNIDREMPDNVWLGVSVTKQHDFWRIKNLVDLHKAKIKFVSIEPLLGAFFPLEYYFKKLDWVIIGRLTKHSHKYDPKKEDMKIIVNKVRELGVPIFMKNNLQEILGDELRQEVPKWK